MSRQRTHKLFCYDCDVEYTVKHSDEVTKLEPECCPFCGQQVELERSPADADVDELDFN